MKPGTFLTLGGAGGGVPVYTLEERAHIRGAMWTARLDVPLGPRPGQPDNCICIGDFEAFSPADRLRILGAYGPTSARGYSSSPMGPMVDPGYHGFLPPCDFRGDPSPYFDGAAQLEAAGVKVIHFLRPDRGVAGLEWTVDDLDRELGPVFSGARAQRMMHTVCLGWEPGPRYWYDNAWYVEMCQWMARRFPNALRLIHLVADMDAPVGGDDDKHGISNGQGWANVAPYLHGWLVQNAGYTGGTSEVPSPAFMYDFSRQFNPTVRGSLVERFTTGGPTGDWPTSSAWGPGRRLKVYAGEYAAFADFWQNWAERYSQDIGDAAMSAGADGYLDGGRVR